MDVLALLDHLSIERVCAVGMSLGAKTLPHVATIAPERVARMILVSATPRFPESTCDLFGAAAAASHTSEEWATMRERHVHGDRQIEALFALPRAFAEDPSDMVFTRERLGAITARTLIVAGDRDPLYPVVLAVELYRGITDASLRVVRRGGHGPILMSSVRTSCGSRSRSRWTLSATSRAAQAERSPAFSTYRPWRALVNSWMRTPSSAENRSKRMPMPAAVPSAVDA